MPILNLSGGFVVDHYGSGEAFWAGSAEVELDLPTENHIVEFLSSTYLGDTVPFLTRPYASSLDADILPYELIFNAIISSSSEGNATRRGHAARRRQTLTTIDFHLLRLNPQINSDFRLAS